MEAPKEPGPIQNILDSIAHSDESGEAKTDSPDNPSEGTDTVLAVGQRVECPYFIPVDQSEDGVCFCTHFQIRPKCTGDINRCDVLLNAPDPRDGYR